MRTLILSIAALLLLISNAAAEQIAGYSKPPAVPIYELPAASFAAMPNEAPLDYAQRINQLVHFSTYHCGAHEAELGPVSSLVAGRFFAEGLLDFDRFECGLCHQRAYMLTKVLDHPGIENAIVLAFEGHVVVSAHVEGHQYLIDPDYGVGPIKWDVSQSDRLAAVIAAYSAIAWADVDLVRDILLQTEAAPYYVDLGRLETMQKAAFIADDVAFSPLLWAAGGIALIAAISIIIERSRRRKTKSVV